MNRRELYEESGMIFESEWNSSMPQDEFTPQQASYSQLLLTNAALREENAELERRVKELEKEGEYHTEILATVATGLATVQFYLGQLGDMEMVPVMPSFWIEAWGALKTSVKLTEKPIKRWEDDLEQYNSIPF